MRHARQRRIARCWQTAAALLCLCLGAPAQADDTRDTLQARDHALIEAAATAMPASADAAPALYVIGVAGDASEDVFRNEVRFLVERVSPRLGAGARALALVNHADALQSPGTPLATRANLRHALAAVGERMRREHDVLLLYLTMHGTPEHELWLQLPGGGQDVITPEALRDALDASGIVHRVVVVSACFSGGFIPALRAPDTLILTAARADRSSFGCGSESTITFFGHAWLLDGLNADRDFAGAWRLAAHAIKQRERTLGHARSMPQIAAGARIGTKLARWQATLPADPPAAVYPWPLAPLKKASHPD